MSTKRSIGILTIINLAGVIITVLYSILQAYYFGISRDNEIYFASLVIVKAFTSLTQEGQMSEILLPIFHTVKRERSLEDARKSFGVILNWMLLLTLVVIVISWVATPLLVRLSVPGFTPSEQELVGDFSRYLLVFLTMDIAILFFNTLFNAEKIYGIPETINLINSIISVVILFFYHSELGIWVLIISQIVGKIFNFVSYFWILRRMKYVHYWKLKHDTLNHWAVFKNMFNTFFYVLTTQLHAVILSAALSLLPQGYYAIYNFVNRIYSKLHTILLRPVAIVFFTKFAEIAKDQFDKIRQELNKSIYYNLLISFYCLYFFIVAGEPALNIIWGSDKFSAANIKDSYILFIVFIVTFIFSGIGVMYRKLVMAYGEVHAQYMGSSIIQLIKAAFTFLIIPHFGFIGLLLIVFLNKVLLDVLPILITYRKYPKLYIQSNVFSLMNRLPLIVIALFLIFMANTFFPIQFANDKFTYLYQATSQFIIGVVVILVANYFLKLEEFTLMISMIKKKLVR